MDMDKDKEKQLMWALLSNKPFLVQHKRPGSRNDGDYYIVTTPRVRSKQGRYKAKYVSTHERAIYYIQRYSNGGTHVPSPSWISLKHKEFVEYLGE